MSERNVELSKCNLLIVDDEKNIRFSLSERFRDRFASVSAAANGTEAMAIVDEQSVDAVLLDQKLKESGESGLDLLVDIRAKNPHIVVVIMTAYGKFEEAVLAAQRGCYQYLSKPLDFDQVEMVLRNGLSAVKLEREVSRLRRAQDRKLRVDFIMGDDAGMEKTIRLVRRVAKAAGSTVLIRGETGVGKELIARMVHIESPRAAGPFIEVNCGSIHENLLESELFGHEKGAFTDARKTRQGLFEMADGGTLFLDEIGEMSLAVQSKLLRVLETRRFRRLGGTEDREVDVRVVTATHRDLHAMVEGGEFRQDLYFRLNVVPIEIPPLRERVEDIEPLVKYFVSRFNREFGARIERVTPAALNLLCRHRWNGNVRELRNVVERILIIHDGTEIDVEHLPDDFRELGAGAEPRASDGGTGSPERAFGTGVVWPLEDIERWAIHRALEVTAGNKTQAAKQLGISRQTLRDKISRGDGGAVATEVAQ